MYIEPSPGQPGIRNSLYKLMDRLQENINSDILEKVAAVIRLVVAKIILMGQ